MRYRTSFGSLMSAHMCAAIPNFRVMEIDIDDVPWKGSLVTRPPVIKDGHIFLPDAPGWGADINEEVLREHPWPGKAGSAPKFFYGMSAEDMVSRPRT
jgi:L-alanine-DL-glutamate epimerase-like enolase superfamily enzyme